MRGRPARIADTLPEAAGIVTIEIEPIPTVGPPGPDPDMGEARDLPPSCGSIGR